ncbi:Peptidase C26 [Lachnospiraceae bacterium]|nr:Peptidase C26 [Lachnospiraceae bacterium]
MKMSEIKIAIPVLVDEEENYKKAVSAQGAVPVIVSSAEDIRVEDFDALLLPGGCDVDPARYHRENTDCGPLKPDLYSTGDSGDHLIEAAHHATLPIWTVQWHPERCRPTEDRPDVVDGYEIFKFFMRMIKEACDKNSV